ncbi:hypothetical protein BraRD5C2_40550 [Bradyrhizobium sp. RD5-C2]|nr:hypothetical protein BraRD5C2_40550 [Bradyrhizobium sp. RD5-C2]
MHREQRLRCDEDDEGGRQHAGRQPLHAPQLGGAFGIDGHCDEGGGKGHGDRSGSRIGGNVTVIASEAKQSMPPHVEAWIASSLPLLAMTAGATSTIYEKRRQKRRPAKWRAFEKGSGQCKRDQAVLL